jgi:hypothetical protein
MAGPIHFVCRNADHQVLSVKYPNPVTLNDGKWSYCPNGASDGHTWEETEATTVEALRRIARAHETQKEV